MKDSVCIRSLLITRKFERKRNCRKTGYDLLKFPYTGRFPDLRFILASAFPPNGLMICDCRFLIVSIINHQPSIINFAGSGLSEGRPRLQWRVRDGFAPSSHLHIAFGNLYNVNERLRVESLFRRKNSCQGK
jgi:hypothetical protein